MVKAVYVFILYGAQILQKGCGEKNEKYLFLYLDLGSCAKFLNITLNLLGDTLKWTKLTAKAQHSIIFACSIIFAPMV